MNGHVVILLLYSELIPRQRLMLRTLKRRGWRVSVIAWDRTGNTPTTDNDRSLYDNWHWIRMPTSNARVRLISKLPKYYYHVWKIMADLDEPDLIMLTHFMMLPFSLLLRGLKIYNCSEMYAISISRYFGWLRYLIRPLITTIEGLLITRVHGVIGVDSRGGWLERFYRRWNSHVQTIWNVPSKMDDPSEKEIAALKDQYLGSKVVAYVGILKREKGLHVAIDAVALVKQEHPDSLFLFIGSMVDRVDLQNMISKRDLGKNIRFFTSDELSADASSPSLR